MISKATIKFIKSLQIKKYRKQEQCFMVEGAKSVLELLNSDFEPIMLLGTNDFLNGLPSGLKAEMLPVTPKELEGLGVFQSNESGLAVAKMKENKAFELTSDEFALVLDDIRDPGNLGTIIRTADWFGITKIIASEETTDFYNPKVITATMGSFTRVDVFYTNLANYVSAFKGKIMGALFDGEDVHRFDFGTGGILVIGNESRGISTDIQQYITHRITIPGYGKAESLNASIATAIICDNMRRSVG